jgi:cobaltochelatase CobN
MIKHLLALSLALGTLLMSPFAAAEKVLLLADNHMSKGKMELIHSLAREKGIEFDYQKFSQVKKEQAAEQFSKYDLVMFDALNPRIAKMTFAKFAPAIKANAKVKFEPIRMPENSPYRQGIDFQQATAIKNYYHNGGRYNFENLMAYIANDVFGKGEFSYQAFKALPDNGFYHYSIEDQVVADKAGLQKFVDLTQDKPIVAVSMHRSAVEGEQTQLVDQVIRSLENQGAVAFGYFFDGSTEDQADRQSASKYLSLLLKEKAAHVHTGHDHADHNHSMADNKPESWVDVVLNARMIHYMDKRNNDFKALNVPVLHALAYYDGDQVAYEKDAVGLSATMSPYFLMMPETSGIIDPTVISAKNMETEEQEVIQYQLDAMAERAILQANLGRKANKDKKVAIMIWNYPPGEKNIGASFLNVPQSLDQITNDLIAAGYTAEQKDEEFYIENAGGLLKPLYRTGYQEALQQQNLTDYLPLADYQAWFATLPQNIRDEINKHWGDVTQHPFIEEIDGKPHFMIPRMENGNIITLPQPSNAGNDDEAQDMYHGTAAPASHYYFAVYLYVKKTFGADAIVHLGTHGSQEWLQGKERGLSIYDSPSLAVGNLPVIYPFLMDNVGEAMQAKRRGRAVMISHMTPGFAVAGLHSDIKELDELMHQYDLLDEGETKNKTEKRIIEKIEAMKFAEELGFDEKTSIDTILEETHVYLHDLSIAAQPLGLHTFGTVAKNAHLITTIQQMISPEAVRLASKYEGLNDLGAKIQQLNPVDNVLKQEHSDKMDEQKVTQLTDIPGFKLLWLALVEKWDMQKELDLDEEDDAPLLEALVQADKHFNDFHGQTEDKALVATLNAEFLDVAPGGDPIRNPEALPTGRNLIGFNPAKVPTKEAYETGRELVEDTIQKYQQAHGKYPDKLAFSLWSLETMRQHGVLESQIMAALGVKPKWDRRGMVVGTEIIEYKELKRPRIDVAISATGLYRDAFPNVMLLLAKAIDDIAQMKEENNSVYKNAQALKIKMLENGASEEDAAYLSSVRIFSNETGSYGTGLADASLASDTWEEDKKLSDMYLRRMGYAFGPDASRWSEKPGSEVIGDLYSEVLSGTDAVVFSRSSNLYGMLTSDDPFQYFGGIALAVRNIDGESPEMYISNLRNTNQVKNETLQRFMGGELRSRAFHPRWIKEMQAEGYSGALTVLDRMNNFWGWTVMDPNSTSDAQWQEFIEVYVNDKYDMEMKQFFEQNNPYALAQIVERVLEAERKDYFETDETTLKKLTETYLEIANKYDVYTENEKFKQNLQQLAEGFGMSFELPLKELAEQPAAQSPQQQVSTQQAAEKQQVEGQQLEKQERKGQETDYETLYFLAGLGAIFLIGFLFQYRRREELIAA